MRIISKGALGALIAVLALGAVMASGALASTKKGEIVNKEGKAPVRNKFTGASNKKAFLETTAGAKYSCSDSGSKFAGAISSTTSGTGSLTLTGCEVLGSKCRSTGAANAGEIVLPAQLAITTKEGQDDLLSEVSETDIKCSTVDLKIKGSFMMPTTPTEKLALGYTFQATGSKGVQTPAVTTNPLQLSSAGAPYYDLSLDIEEIKTNFEEEVQFI
jgi:hypothetical protein